MNIAQLLKLIGLGLNFSGGFILWKYPFIYFSEDNGAAFVAPPEEIAKRKKTTKVGMGFMTTGFLFQFIGNLS